MQVACKKLDAGFSEWEKNKAGDIDPRLRELVTWSVAGLMDDASKMFYDTAAVLVGELESTVLLMWSARQVGCQHVPLCDNRHNVTQKPHHASFPNAATMSPQPAP